MRRMAGMFLVLLAAGWAWAGSQDSGEATSRWVGPLTAALESNVQYSVEAAAGGDFKTAVQGAGGTAILVDTLERLGDDPAWRAALRPLKENALALQQAAQQKRLEEVRAAAQRVRAAGEALAGHRPQGTARWDAPPVGTMRSLMVLMEGSYAEGKLALSVGEAEQAQNWAEVLSVLARVLSNYRSDPAWREESAEFREAAQLAAAADAANLKERFREMFRRCEACHRRKP